MEGNGDGFGGESIEMNTTPFKDQSEGVEESPTTSTCHPDLDELFERIPSVIEIWLGRIGGRKLYGERRW
ncbi:unnamed protein product [Linum trigynum]|uniref:Uncharacterized protein n=1 Tax=Linum trigynum TaxID=586398 RepID=A0AAV2EGZ0_9ROSI